MSASGLSTTLSVLLITLNVSARTKELVPDAMKNRSRVGNCSYTIRATGTYWGEEQHRELWVRALTRLGSLAGPETWRGVTSHDVWVELLRYPAQLAFLRGGLGALARGKAGEGGNGGPNPSAPTPARSEWVRSTRLQCV